MRTHRWRVPLLALLLLPLVTLTGCDSAAEPVAEQAAQEFYAAVAAGDGASACAALAPRTRTELETSAEKSCDEAVLEEDIPDVGAVRGSEIYGTMAQVRFGTDTTFLAHFKDGWKVTAAVCSRVPHFPYDCEVSA